VINIAGHTYLYTLIRANGHIDVDDLVIHDLQSGPDSPLNGPPALTDAPTDQTLNDPEPDFHTIGRVSLHSSRQLLWVGLYSKTACGAEDAEQELPRDDPQ
jgi:hypothetical protein